MWHSPECLVRMPSISRPSQPQATYGLFVTGAFGAGRCKDCVAAQRSTAAPLVHRYNCKCDRPTQGSSAHRSYAMRILLYPSIPAADLDQCMISAWHTFRRRYCASVSDPCFRTNRERCTCLIVTRENTGLRLTAPRNEKMSGP
jgi:hypothetical protein